jgi:hypothetical protein
MAGRMINGAAALAELVRAAGDTDEPGVHRVLPVAPELSGLLPSRGLRRGSTVAVATGREAPASGGTSLLLALLAEASRSGSWCAVVGVPALGAIAAAESGIALDRLALVPNPGPEWPTVVAALIDGVDLVVTAVPGPISASVTGRLVARARQRGSVLVPFGRWDGADVTLRVVDGRWEGLGAGHGRLRRREVTVLARGRGAAARPKELTMWMPGVTIRQVPLPPAPAATDDNQITEPTPPTLDVTSASPPPLLRIVPPISASGELSSASPGSGLPGGGARRKGRRRKAKAETGGPAAPLIPAASADAEQGDRLARIALPAEQGDPGTGGRSAADRRLERARRWQGDPDGSTPGGQVASDSEERRGSTAGLAGADRLDQADHAFRGENGSGG